MGCHASASLATQQQPFSWREDNGTRCSSVEKDVLSTPVVLSAQQKAIVLSTWKILSTDLADRGVRIFLHIFEKHPHIKEIFAYRELVGEELRRNRHFVDHATKFLQAIGAVVENLDNCRDTVGPLLNTLGGQHTHFTGFHSVYFTDFKDALLAVFAEDLGPRFSLLASDAWVIVINFIINELRRGYAEGRQNTCQSTTAEVDSQSPTEDGLTTVEESTNGEVEPRSAAI